jgi:predicted nucleotidyltransferase component of viral defense system
MVESYAPKSALERQAVQQEVMQLIALSGLARGGFFEKAAFYGGTCLHLFYGMERFSENMDFSLLSPDSDFDFESYFPAVKEEFALAGKDVEIQIKHKGRPSSVESAFLKESSEVFKIGFTTQKQIKVKIEVDIDPPPDFSTEMKLMVRPVSRWIRVYSAGDLYAGKVSAALFRAWRARVKGRDWYDLEWYVRNGFACNLKHLSARGRESATDLSSREAVVAALKKRISNIDFKAAGDDVRPFLKDASCLDIWSRDYFSALVDMIKFV